VVGTGVLLADGDESESDGDRGDGAAVGGAEFAADKSARTRVIAARMRALRSLVIEPFAVSACTALCSAFKRERAPAASPAAARSAMATTDDCS
jgi:hypothetical protein